ncbi:MAG: hypothetical protein Q8K99_06090 [Actinomycetota bacterium]|nr:hypothetical protein [Actinomycetota bacterium]
MLHGQTPHARKNAWRRYLVALVALLAISIAYTAYQFQTGLAVPSPGVKALVANAGDIQRTLDAEGSLRDYGDAVRTCLNAYQRFDPKSGGDSDVRRLIGRALDYHLAAREAWEADELGLWEPTTFGDPVHWRVTHPGLEFGDSGSSTLSPDAVTRECWERAAELLGQARERVSE